jgi:hypothetical protein
MSDIKENKEREDRITMEVVVDSYGPEEQALGWYYYLEGIIKFPFTAKCVCKRRISPLQLSEKITVTGMAGEEDCLVEMFVTIEWAGRSLGVPLMQLKGVSVDDQTEQAIADWHYWVGRGYRLCG